MGHVNNFLSAIGYKVHEIRIEWDDGHNEHVHVRAWSQTRAAIKLSEEKNIIGKAGLKFVKPKGKLSGLRIHQERFGYAQISTTRRNA